MNNLSERSQHIVQTLEYLERQMVGMPPLLSELLIQDYGRDPFILLIGCVLSLRARDRAVYPACRELFAQVRTPADLGTLPREVLEKILRPIGFYRTKARTIQRLALLLQEQYQGTVPTTLEGLLELPGVGRKTATFICCYVTGEPAICVDTHVHRLANRFGWVKTRSPEETERALAALIPRDRWCSLNSILVSWGQQVCTSPHVATRQRPYHDRLCPCGSPTK